jgi:SPX domain protein involved in polyphosphate accumulation
MPAPLGNTNGRKAWYRQKYEEPLVKVSSRIPLSQIEEIKTRLKPGQTMSEWIRELIGDRLQQEKAS